MSGYSRLTFSHDTIPPTPPPRSRPHSRSSCRGGSLKRNDNILNTEKRRPPLAPPRSPVIKEKKVRKKIRDDDIKGILESVIARVSETDLTRLCEDDNRDDKEPEHLNQNKDGDEDNPSQTKKDLLDSLYALPVKQKVKDLVTAPEEEDTLSCEALMMSENEQSVRKADESINEKTATENLVAEHPHAPDTLLPKHEAMKANNARMDNLWSNIKHASNLSLNKVHNNNK